MKLVLATILFIFPFLLLAEEEPAEKAEPVLDPAYMGVHPMLMFNHDSRLFASHLPRYEKPHNVQIIYQVELKHVPLLYLVRDADLVTIKPEAFNLQRLIHGHDFTVKADVYVGRFDRGGELFFEGVDINFSELKYFRMLEQLSEPGTDKKYDMVDLDRGASLLVHQIQLPPSYDHLTMLYQANSCMTTVRTGALVPDESLLIDRLSYCGSMKPIYFETQDFAEGANKAKK